MTGLDEAEVFSVCEMILYESVTVDTWYYEFDKTHSPNAMEWI
jgi:hypothetical protein